MLAAGFICSFVYLNNHLFYLLVELFYSLFLGGGRGGVWVCEEVRCVCVGGGYGISDVLF